MVFSTVPRGFIIDALIHIRDLHRRILPSNEDEIQAYERREFLTRDLLSNLPRNHEHPTLRTLLEVVKIGSLTLDGAHKLFGYNLDAIRAADIKLNGGLTHLFEAYPFHRDLPVDLPARLAPHASFRRDARLRDLVLEWQKETPIRAIEEEGWKKSGTFYVHVGTKDSLGSSLPAGSMALVEPVENAEKTEPNPRSIYLLQFPNGYRCSRCVVVAGKLRPLNRENVFSRQEEYKYPGEVRIAGRIKMFALSLPLGEYSPTTLSNRSGNAALILPWEQPNRGQLLATKRKRFRRSPKEQQFINDFLHQELHAKLSERTERRYRGTTSSDPHVNALLHLTLANAARYTDALRTGGSWSSDRGKFSLDTLLNARSLEDAYFADREASVPSPSDVWDAQRSEFGEWPPLLSMTFPNLQQWDRRVVRLANGSELKGIEPGLRSGSWLLLEPVSSVPDPGPKSMPHGWSRPIYLLRRGLEMVCGYLERDANRLALIAGEADHVLQTIPIDSFMQLSRVAGAAVPV